MLDNWGKVHTEGTPETGPRTIVKGEFAQPPLLSLMSLDLDSWGSKAANSSAQQPLDALMSQAADFVMNPLAQVLPSESNLFDFRGGQPQTMKFYLEPKQSGLRNLGVVILLLLVLAVIFCLYCDGGSEEREPHSPTKEESEQGGFATVEFSDGSWAQVYREAEGDQKEALELLFRCNIISTDEFAFSSVSQEHIEECIWIATHMLRQKPLEEWVALWQQAQQTFEDEVTACFEARSDPNSEFSRAFTTTPPMVPIAVPSLRFGALANRSSGPIDEYDEDDPYTTRSHYSPQAMQHPSQHYMGLPNTQETVESYDSRWSIESELDQGLGMRLPNTQDSHNTMEGDRSRWSIEGDLDDGLGTPLPHVLPDSHNTMDSDRSRWSIENEFDHGLAAHGSK